MVCTQLIYANGYTSSYNVTVSNHHEFVNPAHLILAYESLTLAF